MKSIAQLNSELTTICPGDTVGTDVAEKALQLMSDYLRERFQVAPDEVALFKLVDDDHLSFVLPRELVNKGTIPVNASQSVAAKTVTSMKAACFNDFQSQRHITFFEGIKINAEVKGLIQRMLCAPIVHDKKVIGIIQISRKGPDQVQCGAPFAPSDLDNLVQFCQSTAHHLVKVFQTITEEF